VSSKGNLKSPSPTTELVDSFLIYLTREDWIDGKIGLMVDWDLWSAGPENGS
jgi:hypothetical protein